MNTLLSSVLRPSALAPLTPLPLWMNSMQVRLSFPVSISGPSGEVRIGSILRRGMLAALAMNPGDFVSSQSLVQALWDESPPSSFRANLRKLLSELRKDFQKAGLSPTETLETVPSQRGSAGGGARLVVDPDSVDVVYLDRISRRGKQLLESDPKKVVELANHALTNRPVAQFGTDLPPTPWFMSRQEWIIRSERNFQAISCVASLLSGDLQYAAVVLRTLDDRSGSIDWLWIAFHFLRGDTKSALTEVSRIIRDHHSQGLDTPKIVKGLHAVVLNSDKDSTRQILLRYSLGTL